MSTVIRCSSALPLGHLSKTHATKPFMAKKVSGDCCFNEKCNVNPRYTVADVCICATNAVVGNWTSVQSCSIYAGHTATYIQPLTLMARLVLRSGATLSMLLQVSHHSYQHLSLSRFKGSTQPSTQGSHFVLKEARQAAADAMKHEIFGHMGQVQEKILKSWLEHTFDL